MFMKLAIRLLCFAILLAACAPKSTPAPTAMPGSGQTSTPSKLLYKDPSQPVETRVEDLLTRMSMDEKIAQMVQPIQNATPAEDVEAFSLGAVLSTAESISESNSLADWTRIPGAYLEAAARTRLGIPLLYGVDSMHGFGHVNGATIFPHNIGLGATCDPELVEKIGRAVAEEMRAAGIPWSFGPVVAVPQDIRWGRSYEGFSEDTALVTELSKAYILGFQTLPPGYAAAPGQVYFGGATAKHFIGDGGTIWGSSRMILFDVPFMLDQGNAQLPEAELRSLFLPPYQAAVEADVMSIMASYSSWRGTKMHAQKYLLTNLLKGELGFKGFIVADCAGIEQVDADYYTAVVTSINAGVDMSMCPASHITFMGTLRTAVEEGDVNETRIEDAVRRILRAKFKLGLFEKPYADPSLTATVGSVEHRALARQAVRESLVLLKNDNHALPIDKNISRILLAGIDNTGIQSGGWTLEWQGVTENLKGATTIYEGLKAALGPATRVDYDSSGSFLGFTGTAPVGIVTVGELPYAEGIADKADLRLSAQDIQIIKQVRTKVDKLVVVILSGRPLVITDQYQSADAWVAAWLPGSEGEGVADALLGDTPFTGKLPYTWPRSNEQLPINENNAAGKTGCEAPLFPFGYGLGQAGSQPIEWLDCP
jgi:beta-glucosidase